MFNFSTESKRGSKRRGRRRITGWTELRKGGLKIKIQEYFTYINTRNNFWKSFSSLHIMEKSLQQVFLLTYHEKILAICFLHYRSWKKFWNRFSSIHFTKNRCNRLSSLHITEKYLQQVFFLTYQGKIFATGFFPYISWKYSATNFLCYISRKNPCNWISS